MLKKQLKRTRIHARIRSQMSGTALRPRLSVFRSASHIYAQLVDDETGKILVSANDMKMKGNPSTGSGQGKVEHAMEVGKLIAKEAMAKKIEAVVFDRGGFVYHGRVKAVADGAREGGLKF